MTRAVRPPVCRRAPTENDFQFVYKTGVSETIRKPPLVKVSQSVSGTLDRLRVAGPTT